MDQLKVGGGGVLASVEGVPDPSGNTVFKLVGEIDVSNAESIGSRLDTLIPSSVEEAVFDLSELRFMDSSGIGVLLAVRERVSSLRILNASTAIRRVIEVTGLTEVFGLDP